MHVLSAGAVLYVASPHNVMPPPPQVLAVLASGSDQRSIENELVLSLGFEQFELIKELIKNRLRVVWCTKLSRAQVRGRGAVVGGSKARG